MITICTDTEKEYEAMMEVAEEYVCRQIPCEDCKGVYTGCDTCYKINHIRLGIRVIPPVDNSTSDSL